MGTLGLAVDNLRAVELVNAQGEIVHASAEESPDLFWALRGGGGNFGVATWFEYNVHSIGPVVTAGLVAHPFAAARDVLRFYRDFTESLPDELVAFGGLLHAPDGSGTKLVAIIVCHIGPSEAANRAVDPVKRFGSPVMDVIGPMPYTIVNTLFDAGFPRGALNYWKSNFLAALSDEAIDTMIARFADCPSPMGAVLLEHFHGAATRVAQTATAFPHRAVGYNMLVVGEWASPSETAPNIAWARDTYTAMSKHFASGRCRQLLKCRGGRRPRYSGRRVWSELDAAQGAKATLRSRQRIPPESEHLALTTSFIENNFQNTTWRFQRDSRFSSLVDQRCSNQVDSAYVTYHTWKAGRHCRPIMSDRLATASRTKRASECALKISTRRQ